MPDKITLRELKRLLADDTVDERELRDYVILDGDASEAFSPVLRPNPKLIDDEGLEGDIAMRFFNAMSKSRRQRRYRRKIESGWSGLKMVSEGDSWFQYPVLLDDVIDQIFDDYAIFSLGAAGDLLEGMLRENEIRGAIEAENPDAFLISGGGNDMVHGGRIATMLHPGDQDRRDPSDYLNSSCDEFLAEIRAYYDGLFRTLTREFPALRIFCHGYDWAIPAKGKWLGKPMASIGITKPKLQRDITKVIIDQFNDTLRAVAGNYPGAVFHIDCRGAVADNQWKDELHPTDEGYAAVGNLFRSTINTVLNVPSRRRAVPTPGEDQPIVKGREQAAEDPQDLETGIFDRLVQSRARVILGDRAPEGGGGSNEGTGGGAGANGSGNGGGSGGGSGGNPEFDIRNYFEKINMGSQLLPARYLSDGANRAAAVCRVKLPSGFGSGCLIANGNYIITNNHVLEDKETARSAVAEFGYEEGGALNRVALDPDKFFLTNSARDMDYTIVACDGANLTHIEPVPLLRNPTTVTRSERVNIIQHPRGRKKEIAIHENKVIRVKDKVVHYGTDTEPGSSGSPVFNNQWNMVALHHAGWNTGGNSATNEGIRMAAIVADLISRQRAESSDLHLDEIIDTISDSSPLLGFFDIDGVANLDDTSEVELPDFRGTADFADVGCWNIEHFNNLVDEDRIDRVAGVLDRLAMDVMGLVEVQEGAMERLRHNLRRRGHNAEYELLNVRGKQDLAVLYDADTSTVELDLDMAKRHKDALGSKTASGKTAFPRVPLFAKCSIDDDNAKPVEFYMILVHLKAFGDEQSRARRRLAAYVLAAIVDDIRDRIKLPVMICGDFNETLSNDVLRAINNPAADLAALTADDQLDGAISYVGASHRSLIDHIIVSGDMSTGAISGDDTAIVRLDRTVSNFARDVSDHVPLVVRLVAREAPLDVSTGADISAGITIPDGATRVSVEFE